MAELRSLKLALLADTKDFIEGLNKADKESRDFSSKLGDALKKGALAFAALGAAAGAAAIKIGKDAVAAAIEDQQSQRQLAEALKNTTKATDAQIKANEEYITTAQNATGVTDTKLRSALGNLVRATNDVTKAQKLNNLALDISAATGNDLEAVSLALSKAYNGNLGALTRLGIPLDANIIKTKDFNAATEVLAKTFGGAASANAETFAGKIEIIKRRIEDAQEAIGYALLPILDRLSTFIKESVVPALEDFVAGLTGSTPNSVKNAARDAKGRIIEFKDGLDETIGAEGQGAYGLGVSVRQLARELARLNSALLGTSSDEGGLGQFIAGLTKLVNLINTIIAPFTKLVELSRAFAESQSQVRIGLPQGSAAQQTTSVLGNLTNRAINNIVVNVKGAIDPQGTAKSITKVLGTASKTTGIKVPASALRVPL